MSSSEVSALKRPTNVEAQRIVQILHDLSARLYDSTLIDSKFLEKVRSDDGDKGSFEIKPELLAKVEEHLLREEDLMGYIGGSEAANLAAVLEDDQHGRAMTDALRTTLREICREFAKKPRSEIVHFKNMMVNNGAEGRSGQMDVFQQVLQHIETQTRIRLNSTVENDRLNEEQLNTVESTLAIRRERLKVLQTDIEKISKEQNSAKCAREAVLSRLKAELGELNERTRQRLEVMKNQCEAKEYDHREMFERKRAVFEERIKKLELENETLKKETESIEQSLKGQKRTREMEIEARLALYDSKMKEKVEEEERLHREIIEGGQNYEEIAAKLEKVSKENQRKAQEARLEEERRMLVQGKKELLDNKASIIQAFFRGLTERVFFKKTHMTLKKAQKKKKKKKAV